MSFDEAKFTDEDYRSILAFRNRLRRFLRWSESQARAAGLTPSQHQMLLAVRGHPGPAVPTIGEIADHLGTRHHSVVGLVDRAERAGLVHRQVDPHDRRVVRVQITPAGQEVLERLTTLHLSELHALREAGRLPDPPDRPSLVDPRQNDSGN